MPEYIIKGVGAETGRARTRTYRAIDEADARAKATADGTLVESVERQPDPPATERQRAYARHLGIVLAPDATLADATDLISERVEGRVRPELAAYLQSLGITAPRSQARASGMLSDAQVAQWYLLNVARRELRGSWRHPNDSGLPVDLAALAERFLGDEKALDSFQRSLPLSGSTDWPGILHIASAGTGLESTSTIAYREAARLIRESAGVPEPARQETRRTFGRIQRRARRPVLTSCGKCGAPVARDARSCPMCGARRDRLEQFATRLPGAIVAAIVLVYLVRCSIADDPRAERRLAACKADAECWGVQQWHHAGPECQTPIERMFAYPHRWEGGAPQHVAIRWADDGHQALRYHGANLHVRQPDGGWEQYRFICTYQLHPAKVLAVDVESIRRY